MNLGVPLRVLAVLAALVAALAVSACGDDGDGGDDAKAPAANSAQAPDGGNANAADGGADGADGGGSAAGGGAGGSGNASSGDTEPVNLKQADLSQAELQSLKAKAPRMPPYKGYGFDRGSEKDRNALMSLFRQMQREFYAGQFMPFCKKFGTSLYALPDLKSGDAQDRFKECAAVISRIAERLANGELDWPPHAVQWVRVYRDPGKDPYGGVTVLTRGSEVRVSFVNQSGRWRPEFSVPKDMKAINAT